jgi:hypothetical protein
MKLIQLNRNSNPPDGTNPGAEAGVYTELFKQNDYCDAGYIYDIYNSDMSSADDGVWEYTNECGITGHGCSFPNC